MRHSTIITEEILHQRSDFLESQGLIPELLLRLILASLGNPSELRLPFGGSVNQSGLDGLLISPFEFEPYIPKGKSYLEIGTGSNPQRKVTKDFSKRTEKIPKKEQADITYIAFTSRSGKRPANGWPEPKQTKWIKEKKEIADWKDIRIIDGTKITQWLIQFPEISLWLAEKFHIPTKGLYSPVIHWKLIESYGAPPNLSPDIFLIGRDKAKEAVLQIFNKERNQLLLETKYPKEGIDFIVAVLASLDKDQGRAFQSRCLLIDDPNTWKHYCNIKDHHILVATPSLDLGSTGSDLLQAAIRYNNAVIYARVPSGAVHGNSVALKEIKPYELAKTLEKCGYPPEHARMILEQCNGKLHILKRLLLDCSASPQWGLKGPTSELAIASLIGQWDGNFNNDKEAIEKTSGKAYGEWIGKIRPTTLIPDPPLTQRNEKWRFISRYEGWEILGRYISNDDLKQFKKQAIAVLSDKDPKFQLPKNERWRFTFYDTKPKYSYTIKDGFAETLALLGAYPEVLTSCSTGKPEEIATIIVREVLSNTDWMLWATLNHELSLLAEAAPRQFLQALENNLNNQQGSIFNDLFAQEGSGPFQGGNYMSGILWALETLAWHKDYLIQVSVILSQLAMIDPGGNWGNRPFNSLFTIFLPRKPQTCAPVAKRKAAVQAILRECPDIGWQLILKLLPEQHQISSGSHKPRWRKFIPIDMPENVTVKEYKEQVFIYTELAISNATNNIKYLPDIIKNLEKFSKESRAEVFEHLQSTTILSLSSQERVIIWESMLDVIVEHKKYADSDWAMDKTTIEKMSKVADFLKPSELELQHRRLFYKNTLELIDFKGDYNKAWKLAADMRLAAIREIFTASGIEAVLSFAESVPDAYQVGVSFGQIAADEHDSIILPKFLKKENEKRYHFTIGYTESRFYKLSWKWIDSIIEQDWSDKEISVFLSILPFGQTTWERVKKFLGEQVGLYWQSVNGDYCPDKQDLSKAIENLLNFKRPRTAIKCLSIMLYEKMVLSTDHAYRALVDALSLETDIKRDIHACTEVIKWLQENVDRKSDILSQVEWFYLSLLNGYHGLSPVTLEQRLKEKPEFFCKVIRAAFRSEKEKDLALEPSEEQKRIARNAYDLLAKWKTPPGAGQDGSLNGKELDDWLKQMKKICLESGHLQIALDRIGKVLAHAPKDPCGLWIHKEAAKVLDEKGHEKMRSAFTCELFNQRGIYGWTAGEAEMGIATRYRKQADEVEQEGFFRFATAMRQLAESYEREAKWTAENEPLEG